MANCSSPNYKDLYLKDEEILNQAEEREKREVEGSVIVQRYEKKNDLLF